MSTQNTRSLPHGLLTHLTIAGTAALVGSGAGAQIIVTDVNEDVGYGPGANSFFVSSLPGVSQFVIYRGSTGAPNHYISLSETGGYFRIKSTSTASRFFEVVKSPAGAKWSSISGSVTTYAGFASVSSSSSSHRGYTPFTDGYFAFEFQDTTNADQLDFGWIKASLTDATYGGLNLHISSYAYDASGREIGMGELPTAAVPEPSAALALAALSALTLGAIGVRRMKALQS